MLSFSDAGQPAFRFRLPGGLLLAGLVMAGEMSRPAFAQAVQQTSAPSLSSATGSGSGDSIRLYIVQQSLVATFETLGAIASVGIQVDPAVDRVVAGINLSGPAPVAIAQLARHHGLFYWFDGSRYVISPVGGLPRWMIGAGSLDSAVISQIIAAVAPRISPEAIRPDAQTRLIHVSGPRELRDALELAIENAGREKPGGIAVIRYGVTAR